MLAKAPALMANLPPKTLREHLQEAPFALALSSGFFGFFAHVGLLTVLEEENLLPIRVSGSSAGALVAGAWAAGAESATLADELERLERDHFWDPAWGWGLLRGQRFREALDRLLPRTTFDACRVPAALSVFDVRSRTTRVRDQGPLAAAIHASCAFPGLFHPVWIDGRPHLDGGILDRPGLAGMPSMESRVIYHHLASRSPWRLWLDVPRRAGMVTLVLGRLPRSGPFRLDAGRDALRAARDRARRALDAPYADLVVIDR